MDFVKIINIEIILKYFQVWLRLQKKRLKLKKLLCLKKYETCSMKNKNNNCGQFYDILSSPFFLDIFNIFYLKISRIKSRSKKIQRHWT